MFGIVLISACTLMQLYLFWRAASVPFVSRHLSLSFLIWTGVVLWLGFYLGRVFGHHGTGPLAGALEIAGMTWMGVLFLLFTTMVAMDLVTGFGFFVPRLAPSLRGWALILGGVLSLTALVQGLRPPVVKHHEVHLSGLPKEMDGKVLVAMSDLHLGSLLGERWLAARIAQVRAQQPDLVVLLGDIFEGHGLDRESLLPVLGRLKAPMGVWAVLGNHEYHGGTDRNMSLFREAGIRVLRSRWEEIRPGLILAGVDDLTSWQRAGKGGDPMSKTLANRPPGATILLSHTPWQAEKAAKAGAGLMLSGHTQGGQIWPFSYLIRLVYPLLGGRYEVAGMTVIVCRGTGTWGVRMRLWLPAEIIRVTLKG